MKLVLRTTAIACAALTLVACEQQSEVIETEKEVSLETPNQRLSYGVALGLGRNLANDGMTVDVDAFAAGLSDAMTGDPQRLTDEEIQAEMMAFQERLNSEREATAAALAETNATALLDELEHIIRQFLQRSRWL